MMLCSKEKTVYFPSDPAILAKIIGGNFQIMGDSCSGRNKNEAN